MELSVTIYNTKIFTTTFMIYALLHANAIVTGSHLTSVTTVLDGRKGSYLVEKYRQRFQTNV